MITRGTNRFISSNCVGAALLLSQTFVAFSPGAVGAANTTAGNSDATPVLSAAQVEKMLGQPHVGYQGHYEAGRFFEAKGLTDQAIDHFKKAIAEKDARPDAYKHLAQVSLGVKDVKTADSVIAEALKKFPDDYGVHLTAGFIYHNEHKVPEALAQYKKAISISPKNPEIYLVTADVLVDQSKGQEAMEMVKKSMSLAKPTTLSYYEQAKAYMAMGKVDDALVPLKKNFDDNPLNFQNGQIYSVLLQKKNRDAESLEVNFCLLAGASGVSMEETKTLVTGLLSFLKPPVVSDSLKKAEARIKDKKQKAIIHFALGDVYDRANHRAEAAAQYKAGLALNPSFARGYLRLGEDLELSNDLHGAAENYDKAFALDHIDSEIVSRREKLKNKQKSPGAK